MLRKLFALLLVILAVLPFTAPFAVCDLAQSSHPGAGTVDNGSHALPAFATSARMRTRFVPRLETMSGVRHLVLPAGQVVAGTRAHERPAVLPLLNVLRI